MQLFMVNFTQNQNTMRYHIFTALIALSTVVASCSKDNAPKHNTTKITHAACGFDISHHQGNIDWSLVKNDGRFKYVYIKATEGTTYRDGMYKKNVKNAKKHGILTGAYHFYSEKSSPKTQFENLKAVCPKGTTDLVPMLDIEPIGKLSEERAKKVQKDVKELVRLTEKYYGKKPLIYCSIYVYNTCIMPILDTSYPVCIGHPNNTVPVLKGPKHYDIWQYTYSGRIKGIPVVFDMHEFHRDFSIDTITL